MHASDGLTRLVLAAVFAVAGAAKLADRAGTRKAVVEFGAPERLAAPLAGLLPAAELAVAALLLLPGGGLAGRIGSLALLLLFSVAVAVSLARGRAPDCHCFGQLHSAPASWKTLARNGVLAGLALSPLAEPWTPDLGAGAWLAALDGAERLALALGAALAAVLTAGVWGLLSLLRSYGRILLRLERVEAALDAEGIELDGGEDAVVSQHGLQPGSRAPAFSVASLAGETVTLESLLAPGLPLFLLFTSPRCGPCQELLPIAADWQRKHGERLTLAFASEGDLDEVHAEAKKARLERVLHDEGGGLYRSFRANGTPSAVVVAPDGRIGSFVAGGQGAIERLLARAVEAPASGAPAGLLPGAECPALALPSLDGAPVALASLRGRDALLVFWNSSCGFCRQMRDDLLAFEASAAERDPRLVLVCMGDAQAMAADGFRSLVLLDPGSAAATLFGARGTPMAVLLSADGRVASHTVAGGQAVLALATAGRNAPPAIRWSERAGRPTHAGPAPARRPRAPAGRRGRGGGGADRPLAVGRERGLDRHEVSGAFPGALAGGAVFVERRGPQALARRLNAEGVPPPRPRALSGRPASWAPTAIREMLRNRLYVGERVFNRSEWVKDHETGKRRRFERPESEWVRRTAGRPEHLGAGAGRARPAGNPLPPHGRRALPRRAARPPDAGEAPPVGLPRVRRVRGRLLRGLVRRPVRMRVAPRPRPRRVRQRAPRREGRARGPRSRRGKLGDLHAHARVLGELRAERAALQGQLGHARSCELDLDEARVRKLVEESVADLRAALSGAPEDARRVFAALLGDRHMRVAPDPERGFRVEGLFEWSLEARAPGPQEKTGRLASVVAGAGFEPATSGL